MLGLANAPVQVKWPQDLPPQTRLQETLHAKHLEPRLRIMQALHDPADRRLYNASMRLAACGTGARFAMDVQRKKVSPFLHRCRHPMCPFCARTRSLHVADQIKALTDHFPRPRHMVLTVKSRRGPLIGQLRDLRTWFGKLRRSRLWKGAVKGGVYTVEVTINEDTGLWHPHLHILFDGSYIPVRALQKVWHEITGGSEIVWLEEVYNRDGAANELAKYIGKPQRVEAWTLEQIKEYAIAIHGGRMVQTFGNCHGKKVEDEDPEERIPEGAYRVSLSRLMYLAKRGFNTPQTMVLYIAARFKFLAPYIHNEMAMLDPPEKPAGNETEQELDAALYAVAERFQAQDECMTFDEHYGQEESAA